MLGDLVYMALEKNAVITGLMGFFFVCFLAVLLASFLVPKWRVMCGQLMKFAPTIMTALGLFGTFYELTAALGSFEVESTKVKAFVDSLKGVFTFSILGIGSAAIFMVCNMITQYLQQKQHKQDQQQIHDRWKQEQQKSQDLLQHLEKLDSLEALQQRMATATDLQGYFQAAQASLRPLANIRTLLEGQKGFYAHAGNVEKTKSDSLDEIKSKLGCFEQHFNQMTQAAERMANSYDTSTLVKAIATAMEETLGKRLDEMFTQTQEAQNTWLESSKTYTEKMEDFQKKQTQILENFNTSLNEQVGKLKQTMDNFPHQLGQKFEQLDTHIQHGISEGIQPLLDKLAETNKAQADWLTSSKTYTENMGQLQKKQTETLGQFNKDLTEQVGKIEPAIKDGMGAATTAMEKAIKLATDKMNETLEQTQGALGEIVGNISSQVLEGLKTTLGTFDTQITGHLNKMNTELEATGKRAAGLMDDSAKHLKETLGEIHTTITSSSDKLQKELQEFRSEYQLRLNDFFKQQNEALEETLGAQSKQLQETANLLDGQFKEMVQNQETLNQQSTRLINGFEPTYGSLLGQMIEVSENLKDGHKSLGRNLIEINGALNDLGESLTPTFTKAFAELNEKYIEKINASNQLLESIMNKMIQASAALLISSQREQNHGQG